LREFCRPYNLKKTNEGLLTPVLDEFGIRAEFFGVYREQTTAMGFAEMLKQVKAKACEPIFVSHQQHRSFPLHSQPDFTLSSSTAMHSH
jgi:hypothetical protein